MIPKIIIGIRSCMIWAPASEIRVTAPGHYRCGIRIAVYRKFLEQMTPEDVGPEVRSTLRTLRERGKKLAVGSSSKNTKFILAQVGLEKFFDAVSDGTNITRTKPDPEVFLKAAQMLGVEYGCCLVVEDAVSGVLAAEAAHMDCAAMGDAARHHRATYDIEHLSALKDIVL